MTPKSPDSCRSFTPGQDPLHAPPAPLRDSEQDFRADIALPLLIPGELALADPKVAGELLLVRIEATELAETPPDRLPINFACHGIFLLRMYASMHKICHLAWDALDCPYFL